MTDSQRNLLILLAVAVVGVLFSGAFGVAAFSASAFLQVAFTVVMVWFLISLYRRHSGTIASMPAMPRLVMQLAGIAVVVMLATGTIPFLPLPFGWAQIYPQVFWPGLLICGFGIWWSWQQRTSRW